jgi:hypothetical protein
MSSPLQLAAVPNYASSSDCGESISRRYNSRLYRALERCGIRCCVLPADLPPRQRAEIIPTDSPTFLAFAAFALAVRREICCECVPMARYAHTAIRSPIGEVDARSPSLERWHRASGAGCSGLGIAGRIHNFLPVLRPQRSCVSRDLFEPLCCVQTRGVHRSRNARPALFPCGAFPVQL